MSTPPSARCDLRPDPLRRRARGAGSARTRAIGVCAVIAVPWALGLFAPATASADLGSLGDLTVGIAASAGIQPDARGCTVGGDPRNFPGTSTCMLFAGGLEASFLWRGRIGAALGLWSVAGQASVAMKPSPDAPDPPGFPDRVSVPLLLDVRPLAFLSAASNRGYLASFLHGVRLGLGPSFELVRTSQASSLNWGDLIGSRARASLGMHASFDVEAPLYAVPDEVRGGLSLRLSVRVLYVPIVTLKSPNGSMTFSQPIELPADEEDATDRFHGLGVRTQLFLGLVYYM